MLDMRDFLPCSLSESSVEDEERAVGEEKVYLLKGGVAAGFEVEEA